MTPRNQREGGRPLPMGLAGLVWLAFFSALASPGERARAELPAPVSAQTVMGGAFTGAAAETELRNRGLYRSLSEALTSAELAARPAVEASGGVEFTASNVRQKLSARFGAEGVELASTTRSAGNAVWSMRLRTESAGRGGVSMALSQREISAEGPKVRIEAPRQGVTEWYENRSEGLEQGFTAARRPPGETGSLEIVVRIAGTLHPEADRAARGDIDFKDANGKARLKWTALRAWDATGRPLPVQSAVRSGGALALIVDDREAAYPITIDPLFVNAEQRLVPDTNADDSMGASIAVSGDYALLGAPQHSTLGAASRGCAYLFQRQSTTWVLVASIEAADGVANDEFGTAVGFSGDGTEMLIGAPYRVGPSGEASGAVYVFAAQGGGWVQSAILTADDGASYDQFGLAVAANGDGTIVLAGAPGHNTTGGNSAGSAYVFMRDGPIWVQAAELSANDGGAADAFGASVAIAADGSALLLGAPFHNSSNAAYGGGAYVFEQAQAGAAWLEQAELLPLDVAAYDEFGSAVALSGDGKTALVGSPYHNVRPDVNPGVAYVYERKGSGWTVRTELTARLGVGYDGFGSAVTLASNGKTALVGAPYHTTATATKAGSAYVFDLSAEGWREQAAVSAKDGFKDDAFGGAVALSSDGSEAFVGARYHGTTDAPEVGSGYEFSRGSGWTEGAEFLSSNGAIYDAFGAAVALSADATTALVGSPEHQTLQGVTQGVAYIFNQNGGSWSQSATLTDPDGAVGRLFGAAVALSADGATALIGSTGLQDAPRPYPPPPPPGRAYVFHLGGSAWTQSGELAAADGAIGDYFGAAAALSSDGTAALVGAPAVRTTANGGAYYFTLAGGLWTQQAKLTGSDSNSGDTFGAGVALSSSGLTALVGAPLHATQALAGAGAAYLFQQQTGVWSQAAELTAATPAAGDSFGYSVALSSDGSCAAIGAPQHSTPELTELGAAYIFASQGGVWSEQAELAAGDGVAHDQFGSAVALSADGASALVGAPSVTYSAHAAGLAYLFTLEQGIWNQGPELLSGAFGAPGDFTGAAVALQGSIALVGAPGIDAGSAIIYLIGDLPGITASPQSQTVLPGQAVTFTVSAVGLGPLQYQWRYNGSAIAGATGPSYTIPSAQATDAGNYDVVVSNLGGIVTSAAATLGVNNLSVFSQVQPGAPPEAKGFVLVNLTPTGIVTGWHFAGEEQWRPSGVPADGLTTGDYTVQYQPVPGYTQPPDELVSVVSSAPAIILNRSYTPIGNAATGNIAVTLLPESLAGTGWRFLGDTVWQPSGTEVDSLPVGTYLIECEPVAGQSTPVPTAALVQAGATAQTVITYYVADSPVGAQPTLIPFATATSSPGLPYNYLGQIRTDAGEGTGFVVTTRVVVTAGHVVFDDGTYSYATNLQWLFQLDTASYEPVPLIPQGVFLMSGYAAEREAEDTPGVSAPASQNLDAAVIYFLADAARGGSGGYLASDSTPNEWLVSARQMILAGYPVDGIPAAQQGEMFATAPLNITFNQAYLETYATTDVTSVGGMSGAPLSVQYDNGNYYPAAIYLGGANETVVRAIDSDVVTLIAQANTSANGGQNNLGGGITQSSTAALAGQLTTGSIQVTIEPPSAVAAGAQWSIESVGGSSVSPGQNSGAILGNLVPGSFLLQLTSIAGFEAPEINTVAVAGGQQVNITFTYAELAPAITSATSQTGVNGSPFTYQITADNDPSSYAVVGALPAGLTFRSAAGQISGTPTQSGIFMVTAKAANVTGNGAQAVSLIIQPALFDQVVTVSFGQPLIYPFATNEANASFSTTGTLPAGLSLDPATGVISGTPSVSGTSSVPITVTVDGASATAMLTLDIGPQLNANNDLSLSGQIGGERFDSIPVTSAAAGVTYAAANLPPGLTINPSTGEITGLPTASGYYEVIVSGTTSTGTTQQTIVITINSILTVNAPVDGRIYEVIGGVAGKKPVAAKSVRAPGAMVTLEAVPARGYYFTGWTGTGFSGPITANPYAFTQVDGLTVTANFRPLADYQGTYVGLLQQTVAAHQSSGFAAVTLGGAGSFSGKLFYGGAAYALNGELAPAGAPASFTFKRKGMAPLIASLQLNALAPISVAIRLNDGTVQSTLIASSAPPFSKANPAPAGLPGVYTALVSASGSSGGPVVPGGEGPATLVVSGSGAVQLVGTLPDGTAYSAGGPILPGGSFPFYVPLRGGTGSLLGAIAFAPDLTTDASASLRWYRPAVKTDPNFPAGWPLGVNAPLSAAHYLVPRAATKAGSAVPLFPALPTGGAVTLTLDDPALGMNSITRALLVDAAGRLMLASSAANAAKVRVSFNTGVGLLSGSFVEGSAAHSLTRLFQGAILQKQNRMGGFYLAPGGGRVNAAP